MKRTFNLEFHPSCVYLPGTFTVQVDNCENPRCTASHWMISLSLLCFTLSVCF